MTDSNTLADNNIKGFERYVFCDICAFDGYPCEKVVFRYTGFRPEDEDGFAYKYTINEFENPDRIHIHRSLKQISGSSYPCILYQQQNTSPDQPILDSRLKEHFDNESCNICADCITDHSFRDARTIIDMLPELFPRFFKNCSSGSINKLQELVN
jgi:hypothetical protein